jgi:hypothetical protein
MNWDELKGLGQSRVMLAPIADDALRFHALPNVEQDYLVKRSSLFANANLLEGVPQVFGFFSLAPGQVANLVNLPYVQTNLDMPKLLDFMGVSHTTAPGTLCNWVPRPSAMPLVAAGQMPVFAQDDAIITTLLQTNIDLRRIVLLSPEARGGISATGQVAARVLESRFERQLVTVRTESPAPMLVTIAQSYYPAWKADVDGRPTRIWRANYAFQAVEVPAGKHQITLRYDDTIFHVGVVVSIIALLACLAFWASNPRKENTII